MTLLQLCLSLVFARLVRGCVFWSKCRSESFVIGFVVDVKCRIHVGVMRPVEFDA